MAKYLATIIMILFSSILLASEKVNGVISTSQQIMGHGYGLGGLEAFMHWNEQPIHFPEKYYTINEISLYSLKKLNESQTHLPIFNKYYSINTDGRLELEKYDPQTGYFRYRLVLSPRTLINDEYVLASGGKFQPIKGEIIFELNQKPYLTLEGKATTTNGKLVISSINPQASGSFEVAVGEENAVFLKQTEDVSVTVNLN